MGKGGKEKENADDSQVESGPSYEEKLKFVSCIAKPMANKKLTKKLYKLIKKGSKHKKSDGKSDSNQNPIGVL